jgi:hypothetical protein
VDRALPIARARATALLFVATVALRPSGAAEAPLSAAHGDEPGVVLEDTRSWNVDIKGKTRYRVKVRVLIQDRRGFDLADQHLVYHPPNAVLKQFSAATRLPSGESIPVPQELQHENTVYRDEDHEVRVLQFTFPAVRPGAILEWEYEIEEAHPLFVRYWELQRDVPVLQARFTARTKERSNYSYTTLVYSRVPYDDWCTVDVKQEKGGDMTTDVSCRDVPGYRDERWAPPEEDTRLELVLSLTDTHRAAHLHLWSDLNLNWSNDIEKFLSQRQQLRKLALSLVDGAASDAEKVERIDRYVRRELKLRASYAEGLEGTQGEAESVDDVLARGGGPGNDVTLVTLAMLKEAGIDAEPVLVQDRSDGRLVWDYPRFNQTDHLMLRLSLDGKETFLDPACKECRVGLPDWRYCSDEPNGVLVRSASSTPRRVTVGFVPASINLESRSERVVLQEDGSAAVEGRIVWHGQQAAGVRRSWRDVSRSARREDVIERLPGDVSDPAVEVSDPDDLDVDPSARYSYRRADRTIEVGGRLLIGPPDVFSSRLRLPFHLERQHAIWLRYPFAVDSEVTFVVPEGFAAPELPAATALESAGARFESRWSRGDRPQELVWTGRLTVDDVWIDPTSYRDLAGFVDRLRRVLGGGLILRREG